MPVTLKSRLPEIVLELRPRMSAVVKEGAETVAESAKARVPVDTGALQKSIKARRSRQLEYTVGVGEFYGFFVEFGTVKHAAQPFLVPALEEHRDEIVALGRAILERL
jgi:HK97 gp10 family phage protein